MIYSTYTASNVGTGTLSHEVENTNYHKADLRVAELNRMICCIDSLARTLIMYDDDDDAGREDAGLPGARPQLDDFPLRERDQRDPR